MLTKAIGGLFSAIGAAHILKPDFVWATGFYPAGTPAGHPMWIFTIQAFGGFIVALGMSLLNYPAHGLIAGGASVTAVSIKSVGVVSPPALIGVLLTTAGVVTLLEEDKHKKN